MREDLVVVVPAYRAEGTIRSVVEGVRGVLGRVVVIDDGSPDRTGKVASSAGAIVVPHPSNQGKGAALMTGLRWASAHGIGRVVTLDADGQHFPDEIPVLLRASDAAPQALVVGVRQKEGQEIHAVNRFGNWVADTLLGLIAGQPLPDTQSGFRVYPVEETLALGAVGTRYDFETEILLRAARARIPIVGVPTRVYYPPIAERVSHFDPWWDTGRIIAMGARVVLGG